MKWAYLGDSGVILEALFVKISLVFKVRLFTPSNRISPVKEFLEEVKVLHIFSKKKQKTPARELNVALKRSQEVLDL